jgi:CubicO group peptidase (beta-lactamase class C family)
MDSTKLEEMLAYIEEENLPITSVLIVRHGSLVMEAYPQRYAGPDVKRKLYSATKSFISALIGIAIQEGFLESVDQKVIDFFPERTIKNLDARKRDITIEHLLTMTPGYQWDMGDGSRMRDSQDPVQYVLDKPMVAAPGTVYNYGDGASHLLSAILTWVTGRTTLEFAQQYLFTPLGITDVSWESKAGVNFGGSGLYLTPRDMAKFGYLYLNEGRWGNEQIVSADWVDLSTRTYIRGEGYIAEAEAYIDGYGYQWWTVPESGVFYASGMNEQRIYVIPELDMVVVFTANNPGQNVTYGLASQFIYPAFEERPISRYSKYGFSFEYPFGMQVREWPFLGHEAISDASGDVEFRFEYPFFEYISITWLTSEELPDLEKLLEEVYASAELEFTRQGPVERVSRSRREMAYQTFELIDDGLTLQGAVGAWYNSQQKRSYIFAYAALPNPGVEVDVLDKFWTYLAAFSDE